MKNKISMLFMAFIICLSAFGLSVANAQTEAKSSMSFTDIDITEKSVYYAGDTITVTPEISGSAAGVTYKYVWDVNSWSDWGVIKDFSSAKSVQFTLPKTGKFRFTIDIMQGGKTITKSKTINVVEPDFNLNGVSIPNKAYYEVDDVVTFSPKVTGALNGKLKFKYVWNYNDWQSWGVAKDLSTSTSAHIQLKSPGKYTLIIDAAYGNKVVTKSVSIYVVEKGGWDFPELSVTNKSTYYPGDEISITPKIVGNSAGVTYKYVWHVDGWYDWGVASDFSSNSSMKHNIVAPGSYTLVVDAKKGNKVITKSYAINVASGITGVQISNQSTYFTGDVINIKPIIKGNPKNVKYKYVWNANNWQSWGVIKDASSLTSVNQGITAIGKYTVVVDAVYGKKVESVSKTINVADWFKNDGISTPGVSSYRVGVPVKLVGASSGSDYGAKYKFVYQYDNWRHWGVIKDFDSNNTAGFTPRIAGQCTIILDVLCNGKVITKSFVINVEDKWNVASVNVSEKPLYLPNKPVTISPTIGGITDGLQYKFVYSKNNWENWGVISNFSSNSKVTFTPKERGVYDLIVDVRDSAGKVITKSTKIVVSDFGWAIGDWSFSTPSPMNAYQSTTIEFNAYGYEMPGIQYRFRAHNESTNNTTTLMDYTTGRNYVQWTPKEPGTYTIYLEAKDSKGNTDQRTTKFIVNPVIDSSLNVTLSNNNVTVPQGKSVYVKKNSANGAIKFVSNNNAIATVDANNGYVYAKAIGSTQIRAVDSAGKTAAVCAVNVVESEPIRFSYSSPNCAPKNSNVIMYATTDTTRTAAKFVVNGKTYNASKVATEGGTYVWSAQIYMTTPGTTNVKAYSYKNGAWSTCANGDTTIFVISSTNTTATTSENRRMSDKGLQFLAESEGFVSSVYNDGGGTPTLGYGNVIYGGEQFYDGYTEREGRAEMMALVNNEGYSVEVNKLLVQNGIKFNQHQFDALVSYSYNRGYSWATKYYENTYPEKAILRRLVLSCGGNLNNINRDAFIKEFQAQHHFASNGKCSKGLLYRRINELEIFFDNEYKRVMNDAEISKSKYYIDIKTCPNYK